MRTIDVVIKLRITYNRQKKYANLSQMNDISFITNTITTYKKTILKMLIRYDTNNIDIADIIDDTDIIKPSLIRIEYSQTHSQ